MLDVMARASSPISLDVRFSVAPGEILALVGPSGSGKSTVLRTVAGLYSPTHAKVRVSGETWLDTENGVALPPHRRRVGMVFQSYALFPHLTAAANVMAALGHLPRSARSVEARRLLEQVNLAGLEMRRPAELSGGQQQRIAVARALAREPRALLLDEPFSAVDRATRERLYREIADLRRIMKMPVVLVTHDMDEAQMLADRLVVLHQGRSLQEGRPGDIMMRPDSAEVARLVGLRNIFTAERDSMGLVWQGLRLEGPSGPQATVPWAIPDGFVILHRLDRPSRGEHENPVPGQVSRVQITGQTAHITLRPDHAPDLPLHFSVPLHVAGRNGVAPGVNATVSLLAGGIHVMRD